MPGQASLHCTHTWEHLGLDESYPIVLIRTWGKAVAVGREERGKGLREGWTPGPVALGRLAVSPSVSRPWWLQACTPGEVILIGSPTPRQGNSLSQFSLSFHRGGQRD